MNAQHNKQALVTVLLKGDIDLPAVTQYIYVTISIPEYIRHSDLLYRISLALEIDHDTEDILSFQYQIL